MDPDRRVLLVHFDFLTAELPTGLWACPGGGIDAAESPAQGLIRELQEELGLTIDDPGAPVWEKEHIFPMTRWDGQHDMFFLVEVDAFEPKPQLTDAELRAEHVDTMRWWPYDDVQTAQRWYDEVQTAQRWYDEGRRTIPAYVTFSPRRLGHLLNDLLANGRPPQPLQLDPL